jgi:hypothetical protein
MHDRSRRHSIPFPDSSVSSTQDGSHGILISRAFAPSDLDIDDLATALRLLLAGDDPVPRQCTDLNLLSSPNGVTHVVEGEAPL